MRLSSEEFDDIVLRERQEKNEGKQRVLKWWFV